MIAVTVSVRVKPGCEADFIAATKANHDGSVKEPGCLRFDLLQVRGEVGAFLLYEAWESDAAALSHKETDHYRAWRAAVEPWMAEPRRGITHEIICPEDRGAW